MIKRFGFQSILLGALLLGIYLIYSIVSTPYIGISLEQQNGDQWFVTKVDSISWGKENNIRTGDQIVSIDDQSPSEIRSVRKNQIISKVQKIELLRGQQSFTFFVEEDHSFTLFIHMVIPAVFFFVFYIISILIYIRKKEDSAARILILYFLALSLSYLSAGSSNRGDVIGQMTMSLALSFVPLLSIHFLYQYLLKNGIRILPTYLLMVMYGINITIVLLDEIYMLSNMQSPLFGQGIKMTLLAYFCLQNILNLYILFKEYRKNRKTNHRNLLKYTLVANLIPCFFFIFLFAIPYILFNVQLVHAAIAAMSIIVLAVMYIYLITTNELFDIDFIINRVTYYSVMSIVPTVLIVALIAFILNQETYTVIKWFQVTFSIYVGLIFFLYIKEFIDFRFQKKLFKEKYNFQGSLSRFTQDISKIMKVPDLEEKLLKEIEEVMDVKSLALIELETNSKNYKVRSWKRGEPGPKIIEELMTRLSYKEAREFIRLEQGIALVIRTLDDVHVVLWVGNKLNRMKFNIDEISWFKSLARYSGIVYENLYLIEGLVEDLEKVLSKQTKTTPWMLRLLFNLSEKERRRLATDLHDSALQDQILWYRRMDEVLQDKNNLLPPELKDEMSQIRSGLQDVIFQIREICNELRPPFIKEMGITDALDHLFEYAGLRTNFTVDFHHDGDFGDLDVEYVLTIYRIVQELLRNASKHSKATQVEIELKRRQNQLWFKYKDNGIGMEVSELKPSFSNMGLAGIRERISSLEGKISFSSALGEGFEVSIQIPLPSHGMGLEKGIERSL